MAERLEDLLQPSSIAWLTDQQLIREAGTLLMFIPEGKGRSEPAPGVLPSGGAHRKKGEPQLTPTEEGECLNETARYRGCWYRCELFDDRERQSAECCGHDTVVGLCLFLLGLERPACEVDRVSDAVGHPSRPFAVLRLLVTKLA